jgi:hypothetical protein
MNALRLKTLVLVIWGIIILLCGGMVTWAFASPNLIAGLGTDGQSPSTGELPNAATPSPLALVPTPSPKDRAIIFLPSATARFATDIPTTPTPTFGATLEIIQYSSTLPADFDPLTGLKPANPEMLNRRPVAVKISSFPREMVRAVQAGLSRADVVYEYYIEDYLTRFIAVYYSQDAERAGPVRSGRYFDEHIMRMYHASLVYGYADKRVQKHLEESDLKPLLFLERPDTCPPLCGNSNKNAEIRLFVDTAGVGPKLSDNSHQDLRAALFAPILYPPTLPAINRIYTHYSTSSYNYWEYDPARQGYKRFSDARDATGFMQGELYTPHIDNLTGAQLTADNVIILVVPHLFNNEFDREDQVFDISLNGSGEAYLFRNGRMLKARWMRDQVNQPIQLVDSKGKLVPMKEGVTFYQVINPESSINELDTNIEFVFSIPPRRLTATPSPWGYMTPTRTPRKH